MKKYKMIAVCMSALLAAYCLPIDSSTGVKDFFTTLNVEAVSDDSGSCGENCTYKFDSAKGTLTISGSGDMESYSEMGDSPWNDYLENINSVIIEDGVTSIGNYAFYYTTSLKEIIIPNSVTSIGGCAFGNCTSLTGITIPDSVISIGRGAFENCTSLKEVIIPDNVTSIGMYAFFGCSSLTEITIPDSVTSIEELAFCDCGNLTNVYYSGTETEWNNITIGFNNECLTNATIYYSSVDDSGSCGKKCTYKFDSATGTLTISGSGDMYNYSYFNDYVAHWNDYKEDIKSVIIENGVTSIGKDAFNGCSSLTSITIPDSVTAIGDCAFYYCNKLTSIIIPDSVTAIENNAFNGCSSLTSITIPESVISIGDFAFDVCSNLTDVYYSGTETEWNSIEIGLKNEYLTNATIHYNEEYNGLKGDIDGDGKITSTDALNVLQLVVGSADLTEEQKKLADLDGDGEITSADALYILQIVVGLR